VAQLYSRLFRYRARRQRAPLEDFLSESLVDLFERMPTALALRLLAEIVPAPSSAWAPGAPSGERKLAWKTQHHVTVPARGYLDIMLEIDGVPVLVIENKLGSGVRAHSNAEGDAPGNEASQLTTYGRWLASQASDHRGGALVLLTHLTPAPADFLSSAADSKYGVPCRSVLTWPSLARRLRKLLAEPTGAAGAGWHMLLKDFLDFLEEHNMTADTASATDIAALQIFLPTAGRLFGTFDQVWKSLGTMRREICTNRISASDFRSDAGLVWSWAYAKPPAPPASYIAIGIRFPDQSDWWQGSDLPAQPHAFLMISSDNSDLPLAKLSETPKAWRRVETDLVAAVPLSDFPSDPDGFADLFSEWAAARGAEAVSLIKAMSS
jgi:hypothetical protein